MTKEFQIEEELIQQLVELKYTHRPDIKDRKSLEQNFKEKFEALNRVRLSDSEFLRLREEITEPDVFVASKLLRERQYFKEKTERHCITPWSTSKTGVKTTLKSSVNCE